MNQTLRHITGLTFFCITALALLTLQSCKKEEEIYTKDEVDALISQKVAAMADSIRAAGYSKVEVYSRTQIDPDASPILPVQNVNNVPQWSAAMRYVSIAIPGSLNPGDQVFAVSEIRASRGEGTYGNSGISTLTGIVIQADRTIHPPGNGAISLNNIGNNDTWYPGSESNHWSSRNGGLTWSAPASPIHVSLYARPNYTGTIPQNWSIAFASQSLSVIVVRAN